MSKISSTQKVEDADFDNIIDALDNCPNTYNVNQLDSDGDGVGDVYDNCPTIANAGQADNDGDGIGNACDNCPDAVNPDQQDTDGEGTGDVCDACPTTVDEYFTDTDGDGLICDNCPDSANPGLHFDGVDDYIIATGNNIFADVENNFTYEFWVNPEGTIPANEPEKNTGVGAYSTSILPFVIFPLQGDITYGSVGDPNSYSTIGVAVGTNGVILVEHYNSNAPTILAHYAPINGWTHIAVVESAGQARLYINGVYKASSWITNGDRIIKPSYVFGSYTNPAYTQHKFSGKVDELRIWAEGRTPLQIQASMAQELPASPDGDLRLYYNFNEGVIGGNNEAIITIIDQSGNGNDGISQGLSPSGLDFDGIDDYIEVPDSDDISLLGDFTFETWVKVTDFTNFNGILGKTALNAQPAPFDYYLFSGSGIPRVLVGNGSSSESVVAVNPPNPGQWAHLAVVKNGTSITHYLNGMPNGTGTITHATADNNSSMMIGSRPDLFTKMKGSMDEVRIWNVARTQTEINATMNHVLSGTESGLVAYYPLDDAISSPMSVIEDRSSSANDGTARNFANRTGDDDPAMWEWTVGAPVNARDSDNDGSGDACDLCEGDDRTGDDDMDGICNDIDPDAADNCDGDMITIQPVQYPGGAGSTMVRASQTITTNGSVVVPTGATVDYLAGQQIILKPGFRANAGSTFTARIEDCQLVSSSVAPIAVEEEKLEIAPKLALPKPGSVDLKVFPNPFNDRFTLTFDLAQEAEAEIRLISIDGKVRQQLLAPQFQVAGTHQMEWNGPNLPAGIYIIQLRLGSEVLSRKLVKMR